MTLEEIKKYNYQDTTLEFLAINDKFKNEFINFAPSISSEIQSSSENKECSCRRKVINFIDENTDIFLNFLYNFLNINDEMVYFVDILSKIPVYNSLIGKIAKTSVSEWENFAKELKKTNSYFTSFSVVKDGGEDLLVFFL